jgi:ABC-2 type transport system ATP-binding protein
MGDVAVKIYGLRKNFGKVQALRGIDLEIKTGQIYGFLGPNGAGKTTLIRSLIGATKISGGEISVLGLDPQKEKKKLRKQIGYMPQIPALYEDISLRDNIIFFGGAHGSAKLKKNMRGVINFVDLKERMNDPIYTFSGGMKQRASLACALVNVPRILFLDEPTSGIDPQLRETFWKHFRVMADKGITIFVSTHQMDEAMYCDKLAILHEGILLADDTPRNLLWKKEAKVRVWKNDRYVENVLENYPEKIPIALRRFGLDKSITRIEIEETSLETVILQLIEEKVEGRERSIS